MGALRITSRTIEPIQIPATDNTGAPLTGKTDLFVRVRRESDGEYLDFADGFFKAAGWTTRDAVLAESDATLAPGLYERVGGLDTRTNPAEFTDEDLTIISLQTPGTDAVLPGPFEVKVGQFVDNTNLHAQYNDGFRVAVHFDGTASNTNSVPGIDGTVRNPVSTEAAVIALLASAELAGINAVAIEGGTLTLTRAFTEHVFYGCSPAFGAGTLNPGGQDINFSCIYDLVLTGTIGGTAPTIFCRDCTVFGLIGFGGLMKDCTVEDVSLAVVAGALGVFLNCEAFTPPTNPPTLTLHSLVATVRVRGWTGPLEVAGNTNATSRINVHMKAGQLEFLASNTAGLFFAEGLADFTDSVTGTATVDRTALIQDSVEAFLVDAALGNHGTGLWDSTAIVPAQSIRDAMKLAPTAGAPAAGSVDEHLDDILTDTSTTIPTSITALPLSVWSLDIDLAFGGVADRNLAGGAMRWLRFLSTNRQEVDFTTQRLNVYDDPGTVIISFAPLADGNGNPIQLLVGGPARRTVAFS